MDIYACGTPHDCANGQACYITAYPDWDGGDFPAATGCKLEASNFCFGGSTDAGCVSPDIVCCDKQVNFTFASSCVVTAAGCH